MNERIRDELRPINISQFGEEAQKNRSFKKIPEQNDLTDQNKNSKRQINLNQIFSDDPDKFIGTFLTDEYKIKRDYIDGAQQRCLRLFYTRLDPLGSKIASICIIHGFGEHSSRFLDIAEHFVLAGYVVHMIDLSGFGFSGGARGSSSTQQLHMDIFILLKQVSNDLPLFLYGFSLGACLIISLLIRNPTLQIAGVITSSALLQFPENRSVSKFQMTILNLIAYLFEDITVNSAISISSLSKDNLSVYRVITDRILNPFLGMNLAKSILNSMNYIVENQQRFAYPILIMHGELDAITDFKGSIKFYNQIQSQQKKLKIFQNGYHELQHDQEKTEVKIIAIDWCNQQLKHAGNFQFNGKLNVGVPVNRLKIAIKYIIRFFMLILAIKIYKKFFLNQIL